MAAILTTQVLVADEQAVAQASRCLRGGGLVAFPTETVYGLGADAINSAAIARLYRAKGRPRFNPLIVHVESLAAARRIAVFDADAERLAAAFWPGPLTLVLPKAAGSPVADLATAGLDTIAVRVPLHPVALRLLRTFGRPIVAPSANRSGHISPTTAAHVAADLADRIDLTLDGGPVSVGVESTIVGCLSVPTLLRPGGLATARIEQLLGRPLARMREDAASTAPVAPGLLASHYAPRQRLRIDAAHVAPGEALLAFGDADILGIDHAAAVLNLSARGDLLEAAANLFGHLRTLDAKTARGIAAMPVPGEGLGEAINDRLRRAAAPRPERSGSPA